MELTRDRRGRVWASTLGEFGYLENDHFIVVRNVSGGPVYSITEHTSGNLWMLTRILVSSICSTEAMSNGFPEKAGTCSCLGSWRRSVAAWTLGWIQSGRHRVLL
jgi:hypothetical protein